MELEELKQKLKQQIVTQLKLNEVKPEEIAKVELNLDDNTIENLASNSIDVLKRKRIFSKKHQQQI